MDKMDMISAEKIGEAIFNLIPEVTRLKEIFLNWAVLSEDDQCFIDSQIDRFSSPVQIQLYKTVKEALVQWGAVQDTQGAPGCDTGWFTFSCDSELEEELINVLQTFENLLKKVKQNFRATDNTPGLNVKTYPGVPPSSPESDSEDAAQLAALSKRRSEPISTCGQCLSLHSRRKSFHVHHNIKSAPLVKDGYNTD